MESNEKDKTIKKEEKKLLKEQKKMDKLAKLEAKLNKMNEEKDKNNSNKPKNSEIKNKSGGYNSLEVEEKWSNYWKENKCFTPSNNIGDKPIFSIVIPPPNITGSLHIGHAMMISIEDCIVRYKRLNGYDVLYLPGLDHAGIATQNVVMKKIGDANREEFLKAAFDWSNKYGSRIYEQFDRMGCSVDYTRKVFTLDPKVSNSVNVAFKRLYDKKLIYRANKIVNWCSKLRTTVSDLEVNYKTIGGSTYLEVDGGKYKFGMIYYLKYYLVNCKCSVEERRVAKCKCNVSENSPYIVVCTTRPETILGDTAICINPEDKRFSDIESIFKEGSLKDPMNETYINIEGLNIKEEKETLNVSEDILGSSLTKEIKNEKKNKFKLLKETKDFESKLIQNVRAINPLTGEAIPLIFDSQADLSFKTGIFKVTPAHDPIDFKVGMKHKVEIRQILKEDNTVISDIKELNGLKRFEARKWIINNLKERNLFVKEEEYEQIMPFCSRSNDIIEPILKEQWWLDYNSMARKAIEGVRTGDIKLYPEEAINVWNRWLENIREWCLSRQLWWGHRIPAYRPIKLNSKSNEEVKWIITTTKEEALKEAKELGFDDVEQDEDVLDTWFSSGLWPFSTLGWPDKTPDFQKFFPTSLLETGSDILFFWVARMVMLSYELCESKPFDKILLHGIVRDAYGRKMSKSLGNVIDPIFVIEGITLENMINNLTSGNLDSRELKRATEALKKDYPNGINKCGADALRFALLSYTNGMKDINLDILRVQGYSRLCNKIYNAYKFIEGLSSNSFKTTLDLNKVSLEEHHRWILDKLNKTIISQHENIKSYNFMLATQSIHSLFYDFCDIFIECSKVNPKNDLNILSYVFLSILKIFNPYMPFITEELHFLITKSIITDYPTVLEFDFENQFDDIVKMAKIVRTNNTIVENFKNIEYLKALVKNTIEVSDHLDQYEVCGNIKYLIK